MNEENELKIPQISQILNYESKKSKKMDPIYEQIPENKYPVRTNIEYQKNSEIDFWKIITNEIKNPCKIDYKEIEELFTYKNQMNLKFGLNYKPNKDIFIFGQEQMELIINFSKIKNDDFLKLVKKIIKISFDFENFSKCYNGIINIQENNIKEDIENNELLKIHEDIKKKSKIRIRIFGSEFFDKVRYDNDSSSSLQ
jgi:RNAse (barnase) inhibitor barstar